MVLKTLALSADWPYWTAQQARRADLLCAPSVTTTYASDTTSPGRRGRKESAWCAGGVATRVGLASGGPERP